VFAFAKDAMAYGMTDAGDLFYATPYTERTKNTYVIPAGTDNASTGLTDWVLEQTHNQLNIRPELQAQGYTTGRAIPSADGQILVSASDSPIDNTPFSYVVDLNEKAAIHPVKTPSQITIYPNPAHEILYFDRPIDRVSISDLSGRIVFDGQPANGSLSLASFPQGVYIIKTSADNQTETHKIVIN
jgi:hypothetical protein